MGQPDDPGHAVFSLVIRLPVYAVPLVFLVSVEAAQLLPLDHGEDGIGGVEVDDLDVAVVVVVRAGRVRQALVFDLMVCPGRYRPSPCRLARTPSTSYAPRPTSMYPTPDN